MSSASAEPILSSWYTEKSGNYARIWQNQTDETTEKTTGTASSVTTWDATTITGNPVVGDQPLPVYAGIQGISYSDTYVYIKSTGLATNTMGPWHNNVAKTEAFPSFPGNAAILYRFPRTTNYPSTYTSPKNLSGLGSGGIGVDGVPIFNGSDGMSYNNAGVWNRDAFFNEGVTFDSGNAHQAMEQFHYHANPAALRHTLGDSVDYDPTVVFTGLVSNGGNNPYTESPNGTHSPIIAWINDGLPMYGPYGYSDPTDPTSTVRRMITGYQMRDGSNGSYDLVSSGRNLLPQWVTYLSDMASTTPASNGPGVDATYPLGNYLEDYAYKGDLTGYNLYEGVSIDSAYVESTHYDLNDYNVRFCVTPEFPEGTWAYFTAIKADGTPVYPYNLGNNYFGDNALASGVAEIPDTETIITVFDGAPSATPEVESTSIDSTTDVITMTWEGIEGGIYRIETSENLTAWDETDDTFTADSSEITADDPTSLSTLDRRFYRLTKTGISDYDTTEFSTAAGGGGMGPPGGGGPPAR
ncbi:MAG: hypothetical protein ACI9DF_001609 [Verrucomicrobiales bacterium]|jgi:hypothetical protein